MQSIVYIWTNLNHTIHLQPTWDGNLFVNNEHVNTMRIDDLTVKLEMLQFWDEWANLSNSAKNHNAKEVRLYLMFTKPNQQLRQDERD